MTVKMNQEAAQSGWLALELLGNAVAAGLVGEVLNPEGADLHIVEGYLVFTAPSTLASTFNIGIGASGADASDLMSAFLMNQTAKTVWQVIGKDLASEGALTTPRGVDWGSAEYLTVTSAAQVSTGLDAHLLLRYIRLP